MKRKNLLICALSLSVVLILSSCAGNKNTNKSSSASSYCEFTPYQAKPAKAKKSPPPAAGTPIGR